MPHRLRSSVNFRLSCVLVLVLFLEACASKPLPEWRPAVARPGLPAAPENRPSVTGSPVPPPLNAEPATSTGVLPSTLPALPSLPALPARNAPPPPPAEAVELGTPYARAVADRFSEPSTAYTSPGLEAGREGGIYDYARARQWLAEQARQAARQPGVHSAVLAAGSSQRGQLIEALVLTRATGADAATLLASARPTVLLLAGQRSDEPAGVDALLVMARALTQDLRAALELVNVIILPVANPDALGTPAQPLTANGIDLERDHFLLRTPEARAISRLIREFQPTVVVDLQEFNPIAAFLPKLGGIARTDALLSYSTAPDQPEFLTKAAEEWFRRPMVSALDAQGLSSDWQFTMTADPADRKISMGAFGPDAGRNVFGMKNAISLSLASRGAGLGALHYSRRVHTLVTAVRSILASTGQRAAELQQLSDYLDREVIAQACRDDITLEAEPTPAQHDLALLDPVTGADKLVAVEWDSGLALRKVTTRVRPCGYWLAATASEVVERLRLHGVRVQRLAEPGALLGDIYLDAGIASARGGSSRQARELKLVRGVIDAPAASYYVPLDQYMANLAIAALEPDAAGSFYSDRLFPRVTDVARVMNVPKVRLEDAP